MRRNFLKSAAAAGIGLAGASALAQQQAAAPTSHPPAGSRSCGNGMRDRATARPLPASRARAFRLLDPMSMPISIFVFMS